MYHWDFGILLTYKWLLLKGLGMTAWLTVVVVAGGLLVGLIEALCVLSRSHLLKGIALAFLELFRCTPILVQLIWVFYALPMLSGVSLSPITASILALSFYGGSYYAEIIRGGILSIDPGQGEAGAALGMVPSMTMRRIILPQALKRMTPALMNQSIIQLKNTSLVSVLAVADLLYAGQVSANSSYRPLEAYTAVAIGYFLIIFPLTVYVRYRERKFGSNR
jgi:polar amino acid transport system permease protein